MACLNARLRLKSIDLELYNNKKKEKKKEKTTVKGSKKGDTGASTGCLASFTSTGRRRPGRPNLLNLRKE